MLCTYLITGFVFVEFVGVLQLMQVYPRFIDVVDRPLGNFDFFDPYPDPGNFRIVIVTHKSTLGPNIATAAPLYQIDEIRKFPQLNN